MLLKKIILLMIITFIFNFSMVFAEQKINVQKILQSSDELAELYSEQEFIISDEWLDENGNPYKNNDIKTVYVKTKTVYNMGKPIISESSYVSKEDYLSYDNSTSARQIGNCTTLQSGMYNDCWETSYKRLTIAFSYTDYPNDLYKCRIAIINLWKQMPSVRSYDTIGLLHNGDFTLSNAHGHQYYKTSDSDTLQVINYGYKGNNMKIAENGVSISQNLVNNADGFLQNDMYVYGTLSRTNPNQFTASFQHAVKDISLATSKNFTFSGDGMGRVFDWNEPYSNWDNMNGVCVNLSSDYLWFC